MTQVYFTSLHAIALNTKNTCPVFSFSDFSPSNTTLFLTSICFCSWLWWIRTGRYCNCLQFLPVPLCFFGWHFDLVCFWRKSFSPYQTVILIFTQLLSKGFSGGMKPSQTRITETRFIFLPQRFPKINQRFPPKKKSSYVILWLILCLPHSQSLTLVFCILSLVPQEGLSKKQWTPPSPTDGPRFFEHRQPAIYWLISKLKEGLAQCCLWHNCRSCSVPAKSRV